MKRKLVMTVAAGALITSLMAPAIAHGDEERFPESQYRHDIMEHFKYAIGPLVMNAQGKVQHRDHIAALAKIVAETATMTKSAFEKDTRGMEGMTKAKDKIWENWDDFARRMDELERDTAAFAEIAASTDDMGQIMGGFKNVGRHCKSCHDEYKED